MLCSFPIGALTASFKHGPKQVWAVQQLQQAIATARLSKKEAATIQGLSEPQWSRQCQNVEGAHISYQRVFEFPAEVLVALVRGLSKELGLVCIEQKELQQLVTVNQQIAAAIEARQQIPLTVEAERRIA